MSGGATNTTWDKIINPDQNQRPIVKTVLGIALAALATILCAAIDHILKEE